MNETLQIIIKANVAEAQKSLQEVQKELKNTEKESSGFGKKFGSVMKTAAKAVGETLVKATKAAAVAVAGLSVAAVKSFADYEQLVGGVDTLFGEASQKVQKYADEAYKTAGMSANAYMETVTSFSASLLQSLDGDTNAAADAANQAVIDMSDNANKMGTSIESIQNAYQGFAKQNYTMLDNLKLGYGGTKKEMERLLADAEKISGVKYDISNLNDVYGAIHVIQTELGITGTTALEASTTIQGSAASMKAAWSNLLTGLATDMGNFDKVIAKFVKSVKTTISNVLPAIKTVAQKIPPLIQELLPELISVVTEISTQLIPTIIDVSIGIINALENALPNIIAAIIELIPPLMEGLTEALPTIIDGILQIIILLCENFQSIIQPIIDALPTIIMAIVNALLNNLPTLINGVIQLVLGIVAATGQIIETLAPMIPDIIFAIVEAIIAAIPDILAGVWQVVLSLFSLMGDCVTGLWGYVTSFWDNVKELFGKVADWFNEHVIKPIKDLFKGLWQGIKDIFASVGNFFKETFQKGVDKIKEVFGKITGFFSDVWTKIKNIFSKVGEVVGNAITNTVKKAINAVLSTAVRIINGFISAINLAISVINAIPGVNIKKLSKLETPQLAKGGVVDTATLALIGEQGKEAVVPLENNTEWLDMLEERLSGNRDVATPIILNVDGKTFAQTSIKTINELTAQTGTLGLRVM